MNRLVAAGFSVAEGKGEVQQPAIRKSPPSSPSASEKSAPSSPSSREENSVIASPLVMDSKALQIRAALKDAVGKIVEVQVGSFEDRAASTFVLLKRGVSQCSALSGDICEEILSELGEKRIVLEFLCRVAQERRMYAKQVKATVELLLKCKSWQEAWQESGDLHTALPTNVLSNCTSEQDTMVATALPSMRDTNSSIPHMLAENSGGHEAAALEKDMEQLVKKYVQQLVRRAACNEPVAVESPHTSSLDVSSTVVETPVLMQAEPQDEGKLGNDVPLPEKSDYQSESQPVASKEDAYGTLKASLPLALREDAEESLNHEMHAGPPLVRKRDKVKAFFRRALMCVL